MTSIAEYGDTATPDRTQPWWSSIEDPGLKQVISTGLSENPGLAAAQARTDIAQANTWQSMSALLPTIVFEAATQQAPTDVMSLNPGAAAFPDYSEAFQSLGQLLSDVSALTGGDPNDIPDFSGGESTDIPETYRQSSTMLKGSWGIDVFGRQTLSTMAAHRDARAAQSGEHAQMRSLAGQLGSAWYNLVAAREQKRVVSEQVQTAKDMLEIVQLRYERGEGSALDVLQQRQQLAGTQALLPRAEAGEKAAHGRLSVALGQAPSAPLPPSNGWPELGPTPDIGKPSRLVDDRADVRAAIQTVEAARLRRAASFSALAPTLTLTGQYGRQYLTFTDTDSVNAWGVGAVATIPLFAGGRTHSGIRAARAARDMAHMELRSTVLAAIDQVENAITMERAATQTVEAVRHQVNAARDALDESRAHYLQGLAPYVTVLAALGAHQAAQLALIEAERNRVDARIQLHTALGGHWVINTESPR